MPTLTIATLNIGSASKERAQRILDEWIATTRCDVYVLTETSEGAGTDLIRTRFKEAGWFVFHRATLQKDRGTLIATRVAAADSYRYPAEDPTPGRAIVIELATTPRIQVLGMYVPNRSNDAGKLSRKEGFLATWLAQLSVPVGGVNRVLVGDLNVVPTSQPKRIFLPQMKFEYDWYQQLDSRGGLYDAALAHNSRRHESTWVAYTGEGYTYDHIFPEKSLRPRVVDFAYDHTTREVTRLSDHSAIVLKIEVDSIDRVHERGLEIPSQANLF